MLFHRLYKCSAGLLFVKCRHISRFYWNVTSLIKW